MLVLVYVYLFDVLLLVAFAAAWRWGGGTERGLATGYLAAAVASIALGSRGAGSWQALEYGSLAIDGVLLCALVGFAMRTGRSWIVMSAAFQLISTLAHFAKWTGADMRTLGYSLMEGASSYPTVLLLMWGVWEHRRARRNSQR